MAKEEIERTFEAFDYAPPSFNRTIDPAAYAQFVAAMHGFSTSNGATVAPTTRDKSRDDADASSRQEEERNEVAGIPERRR